MAENSAIEWTDHTFNPWRGCTKVSPECENCYAETLSKRNPKVLGEWGPQGNRVMAAQKYWQEPAKWNYQAAKAGERKRVFCASLADVFERNSRQVVDHHGKLLWYQATQEFGANASSPGSRHLAYEPREGELIPPAEHFLPTMLDDLRRDLFALINMTPSLDWLLLTKRPENIEPMMRRQACECHEGISPCDQCDALGPPTELPNLWLGTSVGDRKRKERIEILRNIPARIRFLSIEPLLEDLGELDLTGIHWVIVGGESGHHPRPVHPNWVRSIRNQCRDAGVAFFFKQWGEWEPSFDFPKQFEGISDKTQTLTLALDGHIGLSLAEMEGHPKPWGLCVRTGKHRAGRMLDGREWSELPKVAS